RITSRRVVEVPGTSASNRLVCQVGEGWRVRVHQSYRLAAIDGVAARICDHPGPRDHIRAGAVIGYGGEGEAEVGTAVVNDVGWGIEIPICAARNCFVGGACQSDARVGRAWNREPGGLPDVQNRGA